MNEQTLVKKSLTYKLAMQKKKYSLAIDVLLSESRLIKIMALQDLAYVRKEYAISGGDSAKLEKLDKLVMETYLEQSR